MTKNFIDCVKSLKLNRVYIYYSLAFGVTALILPFAVQFLVNSLALSGIWLNVITFLIIIFLGLCLTQILRHSQVILIEYLQRELLSEEIKRWNQLKDKDKSYYFFETTNKVKAFSISYANIIEMSFVIFFGFLTMIAFHPAFLVLAIITAFIVYKINKTTNAAIITSIGESDLKYQMHEILSEGKALDDSDLNNYLKARNNHFMFTKKNSFIVSVLTVFSQLFVIGVGVALIQGQQLSIGQLVAAEIIVSGIYVTLIKLPKTLEAIYDFETSIYKISKVLDRL